MVEIAVHENELLGGAALHAVREPGEGRPDALQQLAFVRRAGPVPVALDVDRPDARLLRDGLDLRMPRRRGAPHPQQHARRDRQRIVLVELERGRSRNGAFQELRPDLGIGREETHDATAVPP